MKDRKALIYFGVDYIDYCIQDYIVDNWLDLSKNLNSINQLRNFFMEDLQWIVPREVPPLNFTAKEILPSLLDKSKTQTIRKAWVQRMTCDVVPKKERYPSKPAKYKVGDKVDLIWDEESRADWFKTNGTPILMTGGHEEDKIFHKNLGTVEITEVFKIKIKKSLVKQYENQYCIWTNEEGSLELEEDLAKRDGFNSAEEMFKCLDEIYGLDEPKEFWVYRWKWI